MTRWRHNQGAADAHPEPAESIPWRRAIAQLKPGFQSANRVDLRRFPPRNIPEGLPSSRPQVCIVVAAQNGAALLVHTLSSLQHQDLHDWECVVVDDASTDQVLDVARVFAEVDARFRVVVHARQVGEAGAWNSGLALARAHRVTLITPGDVLFPFSLSTRLKAWDTGRHEIAGVYCDWRRLRGERLPRSAPGEARPRRRVSRGRVSFVGSAAIVRKEVLESVGGLNESLSSADAPADVFARALRAGYYFDYAAHVGVGHRHRPEGVNRTPPPDADEQTRSRGGARLAHLDVPDDPGAVVLPRRLRSIPAGTQDAAAKGAVVLVPQVRYHVDELGPLSVELRRRDVGVIFMPTSVAGTLGVSLRRQVLNELSKYTNTVWEWDPDLPRRVPLGAVMVLNDWGSTKTLVVNAQAAGTPTFARIEGVQDFYDQDTGRARHPYRTADFVLGQGDNDARGLADRTVHVAGNSRLEALTAAPPSTRDPLVAINLNFTYDVLTERANEWLQTTVVACQDAGVDYLICPHPAQFEDLLDPALLQGKVAAEPVRHVLRRAGALVTRFSTVAYEAMALGVPTIYHNPHGERAWAGAFPDSAVLPSTSSSNELADAIRRQLRVGDYRAAARKLFAAQVDVQPHRTAAQRTADLITKMSSETLRGAGVDVAPIDHHRELIRRRRRSSPG